MSMKIKDFTINNANDMDELIKNGSIRIDYKGKHNKNLYFIASYSGMIDVMELLEKKYGVSFGSMNVDDDTPFTRAPYMGNMKIVKYFFEKEGFAGFDHIDKHGNNALLSAAAGGNIDVFDFLINNYEYDIYIRNNAGYDLYLIAAACGSVEFMKYLERVYNWNIHSLDKDGNNAYMIAMIKHRKLTSMKYLESKSDFDFFQKNNHGNNVFDLINKCPYNICKHFSEKFSIECSIFNNIKKHKSDIEKYENQYKKIVNDISNIEEKISILQETLSGKKEDLTQQKDKIDSKKNLLETFKKTVNEIIV